MANNFIADSTAVSKFWIPSAPAMSSNLLVDWKHVNSADKYVSESHKQGNLIYLYESWVWCFFKIYYLRVDSNRWHFEQEYKASHSLKRTLWLISKGCNGLAYFWNHHAHFIYVISFLNPSLVMMYEFSKKKKNISLNQ